MDRGLTTVLDPSAGRERLQSLKARGVLQEILAAGMGTTLRVPGRLERSRGEHERILSALLSALLSGNPAAARRAALTHINNARKAALSRLHEQPYADVADRQAWPEWGRRRR